ncbi:MAG: ATP-dependent protease ATPase subunit HslU [Christensenellaceae bacterium]|jgi:ATP-dependent HslUV protease ATP-binding subunit HslU|nr:ATP-dependent protease ATPase subunit HslU [Christensenellaceae bacterium]
MDLTPKEIVEQLDRYIIGQQSAKRAVAVALRNRYRRSRLPKGISDEITPKNIIMKGPTGVGKTEIARRLAKLVGAPFIKVEATKYTEVGYVGRDVESMVRDLVEASIRMVREEKQQEVKEKTQAVVRKRLIDAITFMKKQKATETPEDILRGQTEQEYDEGKLENFLIEVDVQNAPQTISLMGQAPMEMGLELGNIFDNVMSQFKGAPKRPSKKRLVAVSVAREQMTAEEGDRLIDKEAMIHEGLEKAEQQGIIFIDEIDKIASKGGGNGPEVSREGVQRDILPIVEGCTVQTKYGAIKTDFILFVAAGAFHISKPTDLIPELQGRFPIRVELASLTKEDFVKILTQPDNAITKQYTQLLSVDGVDLSFTNEALEEIASLAERENETNENLGARRLYNIVEALLEEVSFGADGKHKKTVVVDKEFVDKNMSMLIKKTDLRKFVL